ncbi:MAG: ribonuclease, Rne/Rng family [Acidobacteria bacterium OLB17]|nr:MAG: ribonuclease, Rne/Rng family [Acidobacteria bacterium OLB17]MCZ2390395.1 Rne/Rng family ribonuclease [Acidobacteriota bacterium]
MSKEMIVSVNGREKKIAILDNGKVTEFYIERGQENEGVVGNVYKGRVMRVLPGMQSAFVDIGLERDAFLYVSDFFDEEEEIEKVVLEKGKKGSREDAKREANERIDRSRIEREKQMDSAQELSEPLADSTDVIQDEPSSEDAPEKVERTKRGRGRKGRDKKEEASSVAEPIEIEFDAGGFERIADDDEGDTGDAFKDAYRQEAIVARVRAVEFDEGESTGVAEVGSLLSEVTSVGEFERIADEEEVPAEPVKKGRKAKAAAEKKPAKAKAAKEKAPKKPSTRGKKKAASEETAEEAPASEEPLADAEAFERVADDTASMAVRRGGRGRRRNGRGKKAGASEAVVEQENGVEDVDGNIAADIEVEDSFADMDAASDDAGSITADEESSSENGGERSAEQTQGRERRGRRGRGGRNREERDESAESEKKERSEQKDRSERNGRHGRDRGPQPTISDLLREGQEILVQIAKEPIAKKGARITSHIALPGRYLVYMPTIEHLGVSRKIEFSSERGRLRTLIQKIRQDDAIRSGGFIVRTAGIGISEEDLRNDAIYLARTWQDAKKGSEKKKSPALIHQDLDLVQRLLRDQLSDEFTAIRVDSEEEYLRTVEFMNRMAPRMVSRVKLYTREEPILDAYGVQEEIDKALKPRVWLKSGGYLVINQTEALVAIDVNTGKFVGKGNARLEDTITKTNLEAVDEIARQIRLRDLGGIIVLDLIDMEDRRNRHKVSQALQEALSHDKSPTKVLSFNDFGLIIMTRKRVKQSLERTMCSPCEYCEGAGWVKSPQTVCYEILGEARRLARQVDDIRHTTLRVHPDVAVALRNSERQVMEEIEAHLGSVDLSSDKTIHQAQFDFAFV